MFTSKLPLSALMLASLLASGVASAVPHPQPGRAEALDLRSVMRSLDAGIDTGLAGHSANAKAAEPWSFQPMNTQSAE